MRSPGAGPLLFAIGMAGLGILSLIYRDFALNWQPVPTGVPWRVPLALLSGAMLAAGGLGMAFRTTAQGAAALLTVNMLVWLVLLEIPRVLASPGIEAMWLGVGETLVLVCGGWISFVCLSQPVRQWSAVPVSDTQLRVGRLLFGVALLPIGLSHFVYAADTAQMVPAWLPARQGLAYLTGAGHAAAGLGMLLSVAPALAATLEAVMMSSFVLLIHIPGVVHAPTDRLQWTMLCVATALAGSAWTVAESFSRRPRDRQPGRVSRHSPILPQ
jgi:uncharacterized membrane protein